VVNKKKTKKSH
jgi:alpha-tubulin suppressor-like RCC1 family protein